ncbi:MAG: S24 family peptidase [Ignavibacteria bacterium]|jgi:SOS-response transcriptional repressor LexA|nr:S24 family peptidase [Ignavibacteria bacterium]
MDELELTQALDTLEISQYFNANPDETILLKANGNKYSCYYINDGDVIIVDTSVKIVDKMRVLVAVNSQLSIKIYRVIDDTEYLQTDNNVYLPLSITSEFSYEIIGAISGTIHNLK